MRVVVGDDPAWDAWRGAAHVAGALAAPGGAWGGALTREEYEERGPEYVKAYRGPASYW
jgi:actin-related protein